MIDWIVIGCNNDKQVFDTVQSIRSYCKIEYRILLKICDNSVDFVLRSNELLIHKRDTGIYNAMNIALEYITSNYVAFLNSGDKLVSTIDDVDLFDSCYFYSGVFYNDKILNATVLPLLGIMPNHQTYIVPRRMLIDYKFPENYCYAADLHFKLYLNRSFKGRRMIDSFVSIETPGKSGEFVTSKIVNIRAKEMSGIVGEYYPWLKIPIRIIYWFYYHLKRLKCVE